MFYRDIPKRSKHILSQRCLHIYVKKNTFLKYKKEKKRGGSHGPIPEHNSLIIQQGKQRCKCVHCLSHQSQPNLSVSNFSSLLVVLPPFHIAMQYFKTYLHHSFTSLSNRQICPFWVSPPPSSFNTFVRAFPVINISLFLLFYFDQVVGELDCLIPVGLRFKVLKRNQKLSCFMHFNLMLWKARWHWLK